MPDDLIEVSGAFDVGDGGFAFEYLSDMLKIRSGIQRISEFLAKLFGMISHTSVQIGEIGIEVVIHFKFCRRFVKQHPATAAEHLNVSVTGMAESCHDFVAQGFFAAYPCHKAVHWDPFRYILQNRATPDGSCLPIQASVGWKQRKTAKLIMRKFLCKKNKAVLPLFCKTTFLLIF